MARRKRDVRGRVVLRMRGGAASPLMIEAAARMARAFESELHGLFVEDEELLSLAGLPFAQEISLTGRRSRPLSIDLVRAEMRAASEAMEREFDRLTRASRVPARFEVFRGAAEDALRTAMKETGVLAIGEPLALAGASILRGMIAESSGLAGIVLAGSEARRSEGPVVAIIDSGADISLMVDTAEALASLGEEDVIIVLAAASASEAEALQQEAQKFLDADTRCRFERLERVDARAMRSLAQRTASGIVVARFGGALAESEAEAARTACALDCPLLLLTGADGGKKKR